MRIGRRVALWDANDAGAVESPLIAKLPVKLHAIVVCQSACIYQCVNPHAFISAKLHAIICALSSTNLSSLVSFKQGLIKRTRPCSKLTRGVIWSKPDPRS